MQPARHLHVVESLTRPVAAWDNQERRHLPPVVPPTVACRVCSSLTTVAPGRIVVIEGRVYHRCPHCSGASRIRSDDADVLRSPPSLPAHYRQWPHRFAARVSYVAIVMLLTSCVVAWVALTVRLIAWLVG